MIGNPRMIKDRLRLALCSGVFVLAFSLPGGQILAQDSLEDVLGPAPQGFEDSAELVDVFEQAITSGDVEATLQLLGLDPAAAADTDDFDERFATVSGLVAEQVIVQQVGPDRLILLLGREVWPFPFPIVMTDGTWAFNTAEGLEEVVNRRVGENEIHAIATAREYVNAQERYRAFDWDGDGVVEYAQRLVSSPENYDGLYWPSAPGIPDSPGGAFIDEGEVDDAKAGDGYFGYRFRILTGQGDNIAGGAHDYVINGNMIAGFGLIAWPVTYGQTGVQTFVVNQYGTVYEKDLGEETGTLVPDIQLFDPDESWELVTEVTN